MKIKNYKELDTLVKDKKNIAFEYEGVKYSGRVASNGENQKTSEIYTGRLFKSLKKTGSYWGYFIVDSNNNNYLRGENPSKIKALRYIKAILKETGFKNNINSLNKENNLTPTKDNILNLGADIESKGDKKEDEIEKLIELSNQFNTFFHIKPLSEGIIDFRLIFEEQVDKTRNEINKESYRVVKQILKHPLGKKLLKNEMGYKKHGIKKENIDLTRNIHESFVDTSEFRFSFINKTIVSINYEIKEQIEKEGATYKFIQYEYPKIEIKEVKKPSFCSYCKEEECVCDECDNCGAMRSFSHDHYTKTATCSKCSYSHSI